MEVTTEICRRVWDDSEGVCLEIRPDQDGLDTIELHAPDEKSKMWFGNIRFSMTKEVARQVGLALISAADDK